MNCDAEVAYDLKTVHTKFRDSVYQLLETSKEGDTNPPPPRHYSENIRKRDGVIRTKFINLNIMIIIRPTIISRLAKSRYVL
jgi:hypothetical protein